MRYFVLQRACLFYYNMTSRVDILLNFFTIKADETGIAEKLIGTKFGYTFTIENGETVIHLAVENQAEFTTWLSIFRELDTQIRNDSIIGNSKKIKKKRVDVYARYKRKKVGLIVVYF